MSYTYADVLNNKRTAVASLSATAPKAPELPVNLNAKTMSHRWYVNRQSAAPNNCGFEPVSKFVEGKLNGEVESFADTSHRPKLAQAAREFKQLMKFCFPDSLTWTTGSYPAGVDLAGSDLDFSVSFPDQSNQGPWIILDNIRRAFRALGKSEFDGDRFPLPIFEHFHLINAKVMVLQMVHRATKVSIDVTCNNDAAKRNTQLLVYYGQIDPRFPLLCKAVKRWATHNGVEGARKARLNSFSLCLLVIHFLQCKVGILPNLQELFPELNGEFKVVDDEYEKRNLREELLKKGYKFSEDHTGAGVLFGGFLKYYAKFDFFRYWISVRRGKALKKRRNVDGYPLDGMPVCSQFIVIEDPFIRSPWNCSGSVWHKETYQRLRFEFRSSFNRLVRERTIFTCGQMSEWRRRIRAEGVNRDCQSNVWSKEIKIRQWKTGKKEGYAVPERKEDRCAWYFDLFEQYDPVRFWNLDFTPRKEADKVPWPVAMKFIIP